MCTDNILSLIDTSLVKYILTGANEEQKYNARQPCSSPEFPVRLANLNFCSYALDSVYAIPGWLLSSALLDIGCFWHCNDTCIEVELCISLIVEFAQILHFTKTFVSKERRVLRTPPPFSLVERECCKFGMDLIFGLRANFLKDFPLKSLLSPRCRAKANIRGKPGPSQSHDSQSRYLPLEE